MRFEMKWFVIGAAVGGVLAFMRLRASPTPMTSSTPLGG